MQYSIGNVGGIFRQEGGNPVAQPESHLAKELGFLDVFCIACGAMISSGIFILPGVAYARCGPLVWVSYFLAGILALVGTLSIIELSTAMPKAGGDYFFVTRSMGPLVGTISGLLSWFALSLKTAFAIFGIAELIYITFHVPVLISALAVCAVFVVINIVGVKEASRLEVVLVIGLFALMAWFIAGGLPTISLSHFSPPMPHGFNRILVTAGFVFVSFGGLLNIASISEEVKNPTKNIPRAMIASVIVISILYALMLITTVGILPADELTTSLTPIAHAAQRFAGRAGFIAVSIAALLAFVTTANAGILAASRYPLALSSDNLFPPVISTTSKRFRSPYVAIVLTGLLISIALLFNLELLVKFGSVVILTSYILTNIAVIILRESNIQNYRPTFRTAFYPWAQIVGIVCFMFLIIDMGLVAVEISVLVIVLASLVYLFYGRNRQKQEYALLHVIERIINRQMTGLTLERELREILTHRDELQIDRFHRIVEQSPVIDIDAQLTRDELFEKVAGSFGDSLDIPAAKIVDLLKEREADSTTALTPFLAIPHIIIPGPNRFMLCMVRCSAGIQFSEDHPDIKAVFVLAGSKDERNFHLQALSAIAQIVQHKQFEEMWLAAKNEHQLRDIVLLAKRIRF